MTEFYNENKNEIKEELKKYERTLSENGKQQSFAQEDFPLFLKKIK